jgi:immunoglobulin-binding protein 1
VSKEKPKNWKSRMEDNNYEPTREEKIQSFKEKKELENKIKNLENIKDEDSRREVLKLQIESTILKAIEDIRMINMEMQLQDHKEKMDKAKLAGIEPKPEKVTPMKVWHVPKPTQQDQSFMLSQTKTVCQHCDPFYNTKYREELQAQVFQPGFSQPTMTLEEFGDKEYKKMMEANEQQKKMAELTKAQEDEDSDKDEINDVKTKKARDWDDWKDANEKGAGNKKR